ncbi:hypothetical protein BHU72_01640 [Desulfuribacillus stibiiarsenatis]|uniref:Oxetanocin A resistance protein n=1 Tax=Desulfuribacillus stibiiarsenatis TaxID=1390249 RepID=A0A1E5LA87_9FIRM|nr:pentapeptide repeat-containing protein [Desulfuribacillus stibiiarsenatis]OEH86984.1 hypothetical protein BHU72_01640 [Desulfuribacillus stibiiarsenatis]
MKEEIIESLRSDCSNCFGLCCVGLYFSASEGFPADKKAGQPCVNLETDFRCKIHDLLYGKGYKGCLSFDCFGAGQKVSKLTFKGQSWREHPTLANDMFDALLIITHLHELLWYLAEALHIESISNLQGPITQKIEEIVVLTNLELETLKKIDIMSTRAEVNSILLEVSEHVRTESFSNPYNQSKQEHKQHNKAVPSNRMSSNKIKPGADFIGADLRKYHLRGANLRGFMLIAANLAGVDLAGADLIGVDMRDANLRGADLSRSIFLNQNQINSAKGDKHTKISPLLLRPDYWEQ